MTKKQQYISLLLCFVFIGAFGSGWNWFLQTNDCDLKQVSINQATDAQEQWLNNYASFSTLNLDYDRLKGLEKIINLRETGIKQQIEFFFKDCKSKNNKMQLGFMLSGFEYYLTAKEKLMGGYQDFNWIKNLQADKK